MVRRTKGEGGISLRPDGRYEGRLDLGWVNGKRKRRSIYGATKAEVSKALGKARQTIERGMPLPSDRLTVGAYLAQWLESTRPDVRPRTWVRNEQCCRLYLIPLLGKTAVSKVSPVQIKTAYAKMAERLSPSSVGRVHIVLHRALEQAVEWEMLGRNVADLVSPPRVPRHEIQPLSAEQAARFLEAVQSDRLHALYVVAITTGMRQGELLGLRWQDVEDGAIQVRKSLQRVKGAWIHGEPKNGRTRRVELPTGAVDALRAHRAGQLAERLKAGELWDTSWDLVFANEIGRPIGDSNLRQRSFAPALVRAGLPPIRFHDLRHTAATLMLGRGVPLKVVSEVLGHASISITADLYQHVSPSMQRQAADAMEELFRAVKTL